jgi:predicted enzyme related to lactoylglutathione lyase
MKAIEIISIPVTDQQAAKEFYLNFGFQVVAEAPFGENKWIQMSFEKGGPSITLVNWFKEMPAGSVRGLVIRTDDIEKEIDTLKSRGIQTGRIDATQWGRFASVKDPDGNTFSLHQR